VVPEAALAVLADANISFAVKGKRSDEPGQKIGL
jgi:hypothetical protein